jgi:hypothetical protein
MSYVRRWSLTTRNVVVSPGFFYENFNLREGYGFPLSYVAVSAAIGAALVAGLAAVNAVLGGTDPVGALVAGVAVGGVAFGVSLVGFAARVLAAHAVVVLAGGSDLVRTVEAFAYPTVATMALGAVPVLGLFAALYGIYLQYRGLATFHDLSGDAAVAAVVVSAVVGAVALGAAVALVGLVVLSALGLALAGAAV